MAGMQWWPITAVAAGGQLRVAPALQLAVESVRNHDTEASFFARSVPKRAEFDLD